MCLFTLRNRVCKCYPLRFILRSTLYKISETDQTVFKLPVSTKTNNCDVEASRAKPDALARTAFISTSCSGSRKQSSDTYSKHF